MAVLTGFDRLKYHPAVKVTDLLDISKRDSPLHYRRSYDGVARFALPTGITLDRKVEFTVEERAVGEVHVSARLLETVDYPLVSTTRALREYIRELVQDGRLP